MSVARQLATKALNTYINATKKHDLMDRHRWWNNVRLAGWHSWKSGQQSIDATVLSIVLSGLEIIEGNLSSSCPLNKSIIDEIVRALSKYACGRKTTSSRTSTTFQAFLESFSGDAPLEILTISSSSTTTSVIVHMLSNSLRPIEVHVLESRPLFEGVNMAEVFALSASVVGVAAQGVDIVLIGANLTSRTAAVSNKDCSLPAVLTAKYVAPGVKIVILYKKEKVLSFFPHARERTIHRRLRKLRGSLARLLRRAPHSQVNVKNVCFEWVSSDLINHFITEDGDADSKAIWEYAEQAGQKTGQYFTNL
jgi:hypothetical protein